MGIKRSSGQSKIKISWAQYDKDVHQLADNIKKAGLGLSCVCPIPRGGCPIGVHLSHLLEIPMRSIPRGRTLIVDDVSDSGKTLSKWQGKKGIYTATLYIKSSARVKPDFTVRCYKTDQWIVYPWEV